VTEQQPWWQLSYAPDETGTAVPQIGGMTIQPDSSIEILVGGAAVAGILQYSPGQVATLALQFSSPLGYHIGQSATLLLPRNGLFARAVARKRLPMYPPGAAPVPGALLVEHGEQGDKEQLLKDLEDLLEEAADQGEAHLVLEDGTQVPLDEALADRLGSENIQLKMEEDPDDDLAVPRSEQH